MSERIMMNETQEVSVLDLLLSDNVPNLAEKPLTASYEVSRLSEAAGMPVVFKLQALPYGRVQDLARISQDSEVNILLAGCISPDLKDPRLARKYPVKDKEGKVRPDLTTPADVVKKMLLSGEIADLSQAVERLSGYRRVMIQELKND